MSPLRDQALRKWLPVSVGLALLVALVSGLHDLEPGRDARRVSTLDFIPAKEEAEPLGDQAPYTPRTLPHDWRQRDRDVRNAWYRASFQIDRVPEEPFGVYLPSVHMNAAVFVNGAPVGDGGRFRDPVARNWMRPLYFPIPGRLLVAGENSLHVRVKTDPAGSGLLGEIWLGPKAALLPAYTLRYHVVVTARQIFAVSLCVVGALMSALSFSPAAGAMYRWFGALSLVLAFHILNSLAVEIPIGTRWWNWARMVAIGWFPVCITLLVHRFTGTVRPGLDRILLSVGVLCTLALALVPEPWLSSTALRLSSTASLALGAYPTALMVLYTLKSRELEVLAVLAAGSALMVFGTHDLLMVNDLWSWENGFYIHFGAPLVVLVIAWMLLSRFARALAEAKQLNEELEARVAEREAALEAKHVQLRILERQRVLATERERIMRDIHDGVGGSLASALVSAEDGAHPNDLAAALREGLDDLRLMVHSLDPAADELTALLGQLRSRIAPRLEERGIRLIWSIADIPTAAPLGPEGNLQVLRVVQEAVNNAVRHSGADTLTLTTREDSRGSFLEVSDNGRGIGDPSDDGHGLGNMHRRAEQIGGHLEVRSNSRGTRVRMWLPRRPDLLATPGAPDGWPEASEGHTPGPSAENTPRLIPRS